MSLAHLGLPAAAVSLDREHETKPHITQVTTDELLAMRVTKTKLAATPVREASTAVDGNLLRRGSARQAVRGRREEAAHA